jgi:imidazole glycerol-phosphate synthase subunit HisH
VDPAESALRETSWGVRRRSRYWWSNLKRSRLRRDAFGASSELIDGKDSEAPPSSDATASRDAPPLQGPTKLRSRDFRWTEVVIVDTGGANLASLLYALGRFNCRAEVTADGSKIASAERVLLPGVGAAKHAMRRLHEAGLIEVIQNLTQPVLGICLGMQLLFQRSAEGPTTCLNLLPYSVQTLTAMPGLPVPHMGWNQLRPLKDDPLLEGIDDGDYAYFVHSYAAPVTEYTLASSEYGLGISAIVRTKNFWGTQFHPERSGLVGARVLQNFLSLET